MGLICCNAEASKRIFLVAVGKLWYHITWDVTSRTNVLSMENVLEVSNEAGEEEQTLNYPEGSRGSCLSREYIYIRVLWPP